jgi:hypothetical protein
MAHTKLESKWGYVSHGGILRYPEEPPFPVKEYDAHYDHIFDIPGYPASVFWFYEQVWTRLP